MIFHSGGKYARDAQTPGDTEIRIRVKIWPALQLLFDADISPKTLILWLGRVSTLCVPDNVTLAR
jgi:hypothetical protein